MSHAETANHACFTSVMQSVHPMWGDHFSHVAMCRSSVPPDQLGVTSVMPVTGMLNMAIATSHVCVSSVMQSLLAMWVCQFSHAARLVQQVVYLQALDKEPAGRAALPLFCLCHCMHLQSHFS